MVESLVLDRELPVGELAERIGVSQPAASQHLKVLRDAGLVRGRVDGRRRLYRVDIEGLERLRRELDAYWGDRPWPPSGAPPRPVAGREARLLRGDDRRPAEVDWARGARPAPAAGLHLRVGGRLDERSTRIRELLHEAAETHHLDKEYTERRPDAPWEDYYAGELVRHFSPGWSARFRSRWSVSRSGRML